MPYLRLDADADQIVKKLAQQIAQELGLDFVGTEHILLAILRHNKGVGAEVLSDFGVDEPRVRREIERLMKKGKEDTWVLGRLPGSPHYRNVVALAIDEATQLESQRIGSEHLLLGLLREKGSTAQRVLEKFGLTLANCRKKILGRLP
jgi:ATP-dependent Clp protease ATP-binding subunit ClpA